MLKLDGVRGLGLRSDYWLTVEILKSLAQLQPPI